CIKIKFCKRMKMKIIYYCLLLVLVGCNSAPKNKTTSIPFELTTQGHILIKAIVNGVEGNFIFDTGAGLNLFLQPFGTNITKKDLKRSYTAHRANGEPIKAPLFLSDEILIGDLRFDNV